MNQSKSDSRTRLLDATLKVVRQKGYCAARVDDICAEAGLTKGGFFHHFKSKDDLALAAAEHWGEQVTTFFETAPFQALDDPYERLLAYVAFRKSLLEGEPHEYACFAGTIVQEAHETHPTLSEACARTMNAHAQTLEADIEAAARARGVSADARSLALHIQGAVQGALILAKANGAAAGAECFDHLRRYLELLFASPQQKHRTKRKRS
ncbi:MAG: TetR/AcrR family transcriptional regulator [Amphiplicatus sp.]